MGKLDVIQWTTKSLPSGNDKPPVHSCFGLYPKLYTDNKFIYKGVLVGDDLEKPEIGVVKARRYKPGTERYWQGELDLNRYAREMALVFTDQTLAAKIDLVDQYLAPLHGFTRWDKVCLKMKPKYFRRLLKFEIVLIENAVRKLQIFSDDKVLEAFSHFTFSESNEQSLLHSFRGNKTDDGKYLLLTPEMFTHKYDIHVWFKNHTCNNICGHLSRPVESSLPDKAMDPATDAMYYNFESHMDFKPLNNNEHYTSEAPKDIPDKQVNFETTFGGKSCDGTYSVVTAVIHTECESKCGTTPVKNKGGFTEKQLLQQENKDGMCILDAHPMEKLEKDNYITLHAVEPISSFETDYTKKDHQSSWNESDIEYNSLHNIILANSENTLDQQMPDEIDSNMFDTELSNTEISTLVVRPNPSMLPVDDEIENLEYINEYGTFLQKRDKSSKTTEEDSEIIGPLKDDEVICENIPFLQTNALPPKAECTELHENVDHTYKRFDESVSKINSAEEENCTNNDYNIDEIVDEQREINVANASNVKVNARDYIKEQPYRMDMESINKEKETSQTESTNLCVENVIVDDSNVNRNEPIAEATDNMSDMHNTLCFSNNSSEIPENNDKTDDVNLNIENLPHTKNNEDCKEIESENTECFEQNDVLGQSCDMKIEQYQGSNNTDTVNVISLSEQTEEKTEVVDSYELEEKLQTEKGDQGQLEENVQTEKCDHRQPEENLQTEKDESSDDTTTVQKLQTEEDDLLQAKEIIVILECENRNTVNEHEEEAHLQATELCCFESIDLTNAEIPLENQHSQNTASIDKQAEQEDVGNQSDAQNICSKNLMHPAVNNDNCNDEIGGIGVKLEESVNSEKLQSTDFLVKYNLHSFVDTSDSNHDLDLTDKTDPKLPNTSLTENNNKEVVYPPQEQLPLQRPLQSSLRSGKRKCLRRNVKFADDINNEKRDCRAIENQLLQKSQNMSVVSITPMPENIMLLQNLEANINLKDPNWYTDIPCECCDNENITGRD